jgi:hypothetical protein
VCSRPGWLTANTWVIAPPVSFATRSVSVSSSASQKSDEAGQGGSEKSWSVAAGVYPCDGRSTATQRRWPLSWSITCCLAWIRLAGDPEVRQITLIDAPAVLGWQRWRELEEQGSLGWIRAALAYAAEAGSIERRHVDVFAHIVQAAINEVALMIARADHPAAAASAGGARSPTSWTGC